MPRRGSGRSTSMRRCCPGIAAPRRFKPPWPAANASPACRSCASSVNSTPARWPTGKACPSVRLTPLSTPRPGWRRHAFPLLARTLPKFARGELVFKEQDESRATYCRRLAKEDGDLDFSAPAAALAARVNGLYPWPSCSVVLGGQSVRLGLADTGGPAAPDAAPGTVMGADADGLLVATGSGILRLRKLQRPGARMLPAAEFLRGFPVPEGETIPSRTMRPLVSQKPFKT